MTVAWELVISDRKAAVVSSYTIINGGESGA